MDTTTLEERLAYMQRERDDAIAARDAERQKAKEKLATSGKLIAELKKKVDLSERLVKAVEELAPYLQEFVRQSPQGYFYDTEAGDQVCLTHDNAEGILNALAEIRKSNG